MRWGRLTGCTKRQAQQHRVAVRRSPNGTPIASAVARDAGAGSVLRLWKAGVMPALVQCATSASAAGDAQVPETGAFRPAGVPSGRTWALAPAGMQKGGMSMRPIDGAHPACFEPCEGFSEALAGAPLAVAAEGLDTVARDERGIRRPGARAHGGGGGGVVSGDGPRHGFPVRARSARDADRGEAGRAARGSTRRRRRRPITPPCSPIAAAPRMQRSPPRSTAVI